MKNKLLGFAFCMVFVCLSGCSAIAEKTNMITDEDIKSQTAGALGYAPSDLTITSRRTEGVNTYANLRAGNGMEYACIINGGNLLTAGLTNPPSCTKKESARAGGVTGQTPVAGAAVANQGRAAGQAAAAPTMTLKQAQAKLKDLGYAIAKADGAMGPKTHAALKAFQVDRGLSTTGELDVATAANLSNL